MGVRSWDVSAGVGSMKATCVHLPTPICYTGTV